jgi:hypothetical protein
VSSEAKRQDAFVAWKLKGSVPLDTDELFTKVQANITKSSTKLNTTRVPGGEKMERNSRNLPPRAFWKRLDNSHGAGVQQSGHMGRNSQ